MICWLDGVVERAVRVLELCSEIIEPNWSGRLSWWTGMKNRQSFDALAGWLNFLFCFLILPLIYSLVSLLCRDTLSQSHLMMCSKLANFLSKDTAATARLYAIMPMLWVRKILNVHVSCQGAEGALTFIIARLVCKYDANGYAWKWSFSASPFIH